VLKRATPYAQTVLAWADLEIQAAAEAHARWVGVRQELVDFVATRGDDPPRQAVSDLDLSDDAIRAAGGLGPLSTLWLRTYDLDRQVRRTHGSAVESALVAEAREALDATFSDALLHVASAGIDRIDRPRPPSAQRNASAARGPRPARAYSPIWRSVTRSLGLLHILVNSSRSLQRAP
jgi:hypothetical protein